VTHEVGPRHEVGVCLLDASSESMPPDNPLPHADMVRIAHWIESGAEL
jgi:hypothetical protein